MRKNFPALLQFGQASTSLFTLTGGLFYFSSVATTSIQNNSSYAWTIATSTTASPLLRIDTTTGAEQVNIGSPNSDVVIGNVSQPANLIFDQLQRVSFCL